MGWGGLAGRLLQPVRQAVARTRQQQKTVVRKTERLGGGGGGEGGGEQGPGRVLMTIELELSRAIGEEGEKEGRAEKKPGPLGFLSSFANRLTLKQ